MHAVVAADQLDRRWRQYLDDVLANGREAMAAAKALLREMAESLRHECDAADRPTPSRSAASRRRRRSGCTRS